MQRMKKPPRHRPLHQVPDAGLPSVRDRIEALGGRRFNLIEALPRSLADRSPHGGDERFETLTARRPQWTARVCPALRRPGGCQGRARRPGQDRASDPLNLTTGSAPTSASPMGGRSHQIIHYGVPTASIADAVEVCQIGGTVRVLPRPSMTQRYKLND